MKSSGEDFNGRCRAGLEPRAAGMVDHGSHAYGRDNYSKEQSLCSSMLRPMK